MNNIFRAPVTRYTPCRPSTQTAIENLLNSGPRPDGSVPACLRLDVFIADADTMMKSNTVLYTRAADGRLGIRDGTDADPALMAAYGDVLLHVNSDHEINERLQFYPLPWTDQSFADDCSGRYLSLLFLGCGVGAVIQEYIPSWMGKRWHRQYFDTDAPAARRAEVMSVFLPEHRSNHHDLAMRSQLEKLQSRISTIFEMHCDNDLVIGFAEIDPDDAF